MTVRLDSYDSPDEDDLGAETLATLDDLTQEGFSYEGTIPHVDSHVLDVDDHGSFSLLLAREVGDGEPGRPVGYGSAYTVEIGGKPSICAHGLVVSREERYAGKNLGRVLTFGQVLARLAADPTEAMPVWGRTQSPLILGYFGSIGGYPRQDEPTPDRLLAFVRDVADYLADGDAGVDDPDVDGHVMRGAFDWRLFSDVDLREWAPQVERLLDASFDPFNDDGVIFVAEPTEAAVRDRMETAVENAGVEIDPSGLSFYDTG